MSNDIALVTGANKGLGLEIARQLGAAGLTVYLGARSAERGKAVQRTLVDAGFDARFVQLDVTDQSQIEAAARRIDEECGRLDALINNAGIVVEWGVDIGDISAPMMREAYEVNVFGVVATTQACLPLLRRSTAGRVVNMSSPLGSLTLLSDQDNPISTRNLLAYSSSKAAVNAMTVIYANALRAEGIRVNAVNPGLVATDLNADSPFSRGSLTPQEGAAEPVRLALLRADGPSGTFQTAGDAATGARIPW